MAVDVYAALKDLIAKITGDRDAAQQYAEDPYGTLAEQGITDGDLSQLDMQQLAADCANSPGVPDQAKQVLQSYSSGTPAPGSHPVAPPAGNHSAQEVVQHLNYITYETYEGDEHITQQLINQENYDYSTHIDNSVDVEVDGDVHGDIDIETENLNATGDGAQIIDGDNYGNANTGDGAVNAGGDIEAPVNTGEFTGVQTEGDVENTVVGDDNQVAQVSGEADNSTFNFGDGDVTNFGDAEFDESPVAVGGGDATNVSDNTLYEGAAIATDGDATGNFEENYEETFVEAHQSTVNTEQGPGDLDASEEEAAPAL